MAAPDRESLLAALLRLDLRLRLAVEGLRSDIAQRAADPLHGLYISDSDVDDLLAGAPPGELARELLSQPAGAVAPRLERLAQIFGLDAFEQDAVLVCLAPDVDQRYERLYGYLQDDIARRRPTIGLVLNLLSPSFDAALTDRLQLGPGSRLFATGILGWADDTAERLPLLSRPLKLDDRIVEYLLDSDALDARITPFATLVPPAAAADEAVTESGLAARLARLLAHGVMVSHNGRGPSPAAPSPVVYLHGLTAAARRATVRAACRQAGRPLLLVAVAGALGTAQPVRALTLALREALLQDAVLALEGFDLLLSSDEKEHVAALALLRQEFAGRTAPTVLIGGLRWEPATWLPASPCMRLELPALSLAARRAVWRRNLGNMVPAEEADTLALRYRLDAEAVQSVGAAAHLYARLRGAATVTPDDVRAAAREIGSPPLDGLARRVQPRHDWNDIVVPPDGLAQLREICARARHQLTVLETWGFGRKHAGRAGLTALFAGQPGTGKTMAAEIIAGDLGLELYRIDLASVVSKYIGETEKNLDRIFQAADQGDAVLLFDEADALFGKRSEVKDAHDRYANVEIAYLLQRLETYDGIAVLTTNLRGNLDDAFVRRLDFTVEFPLPEEADRLRIWKLSLPPDAPLADDVDLHFLARKFRLAGGHIRNIALTSAFLAADDGGPIRMRHLIRATRREYQKLGKLVAESDFEHYYPLLKEL